MEGLGESLLEVQSLVCFTAAAEVEVARENGECIEIETLQLSWKVEIGEHTRERCAPASIS